MLITLEFDVSNYQDEKKAMRAFKADHAYAAHWEINKILHDRLNSDSHEHGDIEYDVIAKIAQEISEILDIWNIDLNDCPD